MTMIKDHGICGYTGTMKNITHGNINNPQRAPDMSTMRARRSPCSHNQPIVTSRVRLHITDAFKVTYEAKARSTKIQRRGCRTAPCTSRPIQSLWTPTAGK